MGARRMNTKLTLNYDSSLMTKENQYLDYRNIIYVSLIKSAVMKIQTDIGRQINISKTLKAATNRISFEKLEKMDSNRCQKLYPRTRK